MGALFGISTDDLLVLAKVIGALTVIGGAVVAVSRFRPVRWIWRQIVSDPIGQFFRDQVHEATNEQFTRAAAALEAHTAYEHHSTEELRRTVEATNGRLDGIERRVISLTERVEQLGA